MFELKMPHWAAYSVKEKDEETIIKAKITC
jgi:hypothetical protein